MNSQELKEKILQGKIFIYPTDTIYGIGCNALNKESVEKIREIKQRDKKPFSIIAPSFDWIKENCTIDCELEKYLPGKYTIILKKKDTNFLSWVSNTDSLGIRIPKHEFCDKIRQANMPFITTSVNFSGEKFACSVEEIPEEIKNKVDVIIDEGKIDGTPSILIIEGKEVGRK